MRPRLKRNVLAEPCIGLYSDIGIEAGSRQYDRWRGVAPGFDPDCLILWRQLREMPGSVGMRAPVRDREETNGSAGWFGIGDCEEIYREEMEPIMSGRRLAIIFLLCVGLLHPLGSAVAQNVKSTFDKSANFSKYKKYTWGSNYLLTQQTKEVQEQINMAIVDSINRNLRAEGFVEDDKDPDFRITYSAGGMPNADVGAQRYLYAADMQNYYWGGSLTGISSDGLVSNLAKR